MQQNDIRDFPQTTGPLLDEGRIRIFDTTLRDGEQSPGASLSGEEKIAIARQLARLQVDVIEAGFPAASPGDLEAVRCIAEEVGTENGPIVAGLARACRGDIDRAWEAVSAAARPRIHTFLATSDLHMARKLVMSREEVLERVAEMVAYARSFCDDVEFSPEDATRSDPDFLCRVLGRAIEAGATTLNIPDTVGYGVPQEYGALMARLIEETPGGREVIWSVHCHDDLGMATVNTLAGLAAGARQAEVTVNGIGERAGNASLEEVVMALRTRHDAYRLDTGIESRELIRTSRMVQSFTGLTVPPNKAVVGANAFAHEAGIHQDGVLKARETYEIMAPEAVGWSESKLVLGKHSGRHAFQVRLRELGFELAAVAVAEAFDRFKELADRKKVVTNADLQALVADDGEVAAEIFHLEDLQVICGRRGMATATVRLAGPDGERVATALGSGPVEAAFRAVEAVVEVPCELAEYVVQSVTGGLDALGGVTVRVAAENDDSALFTGFAVDEDVVAASAQAFLGALNQMLVACGGGPAALGVGPQGPAVDRSVAVDSAVAGGA